MRARFLLVAVLVAAVLAPMTVPSSAAAATICANTTIPGTNGDDTITGTSGRDVIDGKGGSDVIKGMGGDDVLCGGPGNDRIDGGNGGDLLEGGAGNDGLTGGSGIDRASFLNSSAGVNASLATGTATGWGSDTLATIEDLTGSRFNDVLTAAAGPNRLFGSDGNDRLSGGTGSDRLSGGAGKDRLNGGKNRDEAAYFDSPNPVTVDLGAGTATGWGSDTLISMEDAFGSAFDDTLTGSGGGNTLYGYGGDDTIDAAAGTDTTNGGTGSDGCSGGETSSNCETGLAPGWTEFHHDERHTGLAAGTGNVAGGGPEVRWTYTVTSQSMPSTDEDFANYRWYSNLPVGDLDGDGTLEVVVTTADRVLDPGTDPTPTVQGGIEVIEDRGKGSAPHVQWTWDMPDRPSGTDWTFGDWGVDEYGAALVDADGDGLPDVLFTDKSGVVRALKGTDGSLIWSYDTGHYIEAGPTVADLDGDGLLEVLMPTDCLLNAGGSACENQSAELLVFAANPATSAGELLWSQPFDRKNDSEQPAVVDLDATDDRPMPQIVLGSWDGKLYVLWRDAGSAGATVVSDDLEVKTLYPTPPNACPAVRSSPLVVNFGQGPIAYFGWMPYPFYCNGIDGDSTQARISAVKLGVQTAARKVTFTQWWPQTIVADAWKSSLALVPRPGDSPLVVTGYGVGQTSSVGNTGRYGDCSSPQGGIIAIDAATGDIAWQHDFKQELMVAGNVRGSPAVGDVDGDGTPEVLLPLGCDIVSDVKTGPLLAYDGPTGELEWTADLGPVTIGSPAVADLDGDGNLEIVIQSYDGKVYALGGP